MGFPTGATASELLHAALAAARNVKAYAAEVDAATRAGEVSANLPLDVAGQMGDLVDALEAARAVPAVVELARAQLGKGELDFDAEAAVLIAACQEVVAQVRAAMPKDATGALAKDTLDEKGDVSVKQIQPEDLAGLRTALGAVRAAID